MREISAPMRSRSGGISLLAALRLRCGVCPCACQLQRAPCLPDAPGTKVVVKLAPEIVQRTERPPVAVETPGLAADEEVRSDNEVIHVQYRSQVEPGPCRAGEGNAVELGKVGGPQLQAVSGHS